jgi:hypothetical protein
MSRECPSNKTGGLKDPKKSQLSETDKRHLQLIKDFKLPASIKPTDYISVLDPSNNNEVVGEYCDVCKRIIRKGPGMHWTQRHVKKQKSPPDGQTPPAAAPTANLAGTSGTPQPTPPGILPSSSANLASFPGMDQATYQSFQAFQAFQQQQQVQQQQQPPAPPLLHLRGADYSTPVAFMCQVVKGPPKPEMDSRKAPDVVAPEANHNHHDPSSLKGVGGQGC